MPEPIAVAFVEVRADVSQFRAQTEAQVKQAVAGADQLSASLGRVGQVDLRGTLAPVVAGAGQARTELNALTAAAASVPGSLGAGLTAGFGDAAAQTEALSASTATLGGTLGTSATAAGALFQASERAATGEKALAAATAAGVAASREATASEEGLIRVRSRRAAAIGPIRLGGVGLGAGIAIFSAVQAISELSQSLRVSGNEALSLQGRMRNLGASLLSGDVVGAFKALADQTRSYNEQELITIRQTPGLQAALHASAKDIATSQKAALSGIGELPPSLVERTARHKFFGSNTGVIADLQQADREFQVMLERVRAIGGTKAEVDAKLAAIFNARTTNRSELRDAQGKQGDSVLAPLIAAVEDARLSGDLGRLRRAEATLKTFLTQSLSIFVMSGKEREKFRKQLQTTSRDIEATQQQIKDEAARHRQAMIQRALDPAELAVAQAEATGSQADRLGSLQADKAAHEKILRRKDLTVAERETYLGELASINGQIESIQQQITDEEQRHADAITAARQKAHQALIDSFGLREGGLDNALAAAALTKTTADDRRIQEKRLRLFREEAKNADFTLAERQAAQAKVISAEAAIQQLDRDAATARHDAVRSKISTEEQRLRDQITLDGFTKTIRDDQGDLRRLIALEKRQAHNRKLTIDERRQHLIAQRQAEKDLRDLVKSDDGGAGFQKLAFGFLTEQRGFAANLAGNLLGSTSGLVGGSAPSAPPAPPPSPLPRGSEVEALRATGGKGPSGGQLDTLIHLARQQLGQLQALRAGGAHPEARTSRALAHSGTEVGAA